MIAVRKHNVERWQLCVRSLVTNQQMLCYRPPNFEGFTPRAFKDADNPVAGKLKWWGGCAHMRTCISTADVFNLVDLCLCSNVCPGGSWTSVLWFSTRWLTTGVVVALGAPSQFLAAGGHAGGLVPWRRRFVTGSMPRLLGLVLAAGLPLTLALLHLVLLALPVAGLVSLGGGDLH